MKKLIDGTEVPARGYYYLLDWNEINEKKFIITKFDKYRLCDLTIDEYKKLFYEATNSDLNNL